MNTVERFTKGVRTVLLFAAVLASAQRVQAQTEFLQAPAFDAVATDADDLQRAQAGELPLYGRTLPIMARNDSHGVWSEDGRERVWRSGITSPGALALECFLDEVEVPEGATMQLLSPDGRTGSARVAMELPEGAHEYATALLAGDSCIIEYREPIDAERRGSFRIAQVGHAYRDVLPARDREGDCHVNVACQPESDGWEGPIRATVRISVVVPGGTGWCTGTLVNNVRQDCSPYILTAWHCGRTSTTSQFNQYKFYFNFQYATCNGGSYSTAQYVTGAQLKGYSDDYDPQYQGVGGSDFMLLRSNAAIPDAFDPYWAGWDATNIPSVSADGVCIHHPTGAPKRISSYTQTLTTGHPMASSGLMTHYKAKWAATTNGFGVTEQGSSGGGLFKPNASLGPVLIGTLTGTSSGMSCTNNSGTAYFGKMSYHWVNNPNTAAQKLNYWLDPDNTGTLVLGGSSDPCGDLTAVEDVHHADAPFLFPNPASERLFIRTQEQGAFHYQLMDPTGREVRAGQAMGPNASIDLNDLLNGPYFLRVMDMEHVHTCIPFIIAH